MANKNLIIFISFATDDRQLVEAIKRMLDGAFGRGIEIREMSRAVQRSLLSGRFVAS